jgi:hypothetical protein
VTAVAYPFMMLVLLRNDVAPPAVMANNKLVIVPVAFSAL